ALAAKAAVELGAVKDGWNGFSVLHAAASRVGALDVGFVPGAGGLTATQMTADGALDVIFLLGADEIEIPPGAFVIYVGTHGDRAEIRRLASLGGLPDKAPFVSAFDDFYLTNAIARASTIMAECSVLAEGHATLTAAE